MMQIKDAQLMRLILWFEETYMIIENPGNK